MRIELSSPLQKVAFATACCFLVALYWGLSLRMYLAARLAAVPDVPHLQRAIRLEPSNAEYRELLGRNLALSGANLDEAIANYRTAVHLNPYEARNWLDLAGAYQVAGRTSEQEESVEHAVEADPTLRMSPGRPPTSFWFRVIEKRRFVISAWSSQMIRAG